MRKIMGKLKKTVLVILIIVICICTIPLKSYAAFTAILTKPICWLIIGVTDGVNLLGSFFVDREAQGQNLNDSIDKLKQDFEADAQDFSGALSGVEQTYKDVYTTYFNLLLSPEKIFAGDVTFLDANIFNAENREGKITEWLPTGGSLVSSLKNTVANIYILLRNISAVILLILLIYTGIRILLASASPYDQAKWKQALIDWIKALCLLMFMHLIMIGIFYISDGLVEALKQSYGGVSIVAAIRWSFNCTHFLDGTACIINTILYLYVTYLTIVFFIAYFKRLIWIVILILFAPIVAVTPAIGNKYGSSIFSKWMKEFTFAVLLQPFHMLIFFVLVGMPLSLINGGNTPEFLDMFVGTNHTNMLTQIYALLSISMIRPAEKFLMNLFGFRESSIARQGSSESGIKTIKTVEKVVKEGAKMVEQVGATILTGGVAGAVAGGAAGATGDAILPTRPDGGSGGQKGQGEDFSDDPSSETGTSNNFLDDVGDDNEGYWGNEQTHTRSKLSIDNIASEMESAGYSPEEIKIFTNSLEEKYGDGTGKR